MIARCALGECNAEPQTVGKSETTLNETNQAGQVLVNAEIVQVKFSGKADRGLVRFGELTRRWLPTFWVNALNGDSYSCKT